MGRSGPKSLVIVPPTLTDNKQKLRSSGSSTFNSLIPRPQWPELVVRRSQPPLIQAAVFFL
ncbi:hypothetical protein V2J09_002009 [Rumex salicifolius]